MSLEDITLPTNKTVTKISNNRRTIRSNEKGLAIKVSVVDANDQPYDLSNITLEFNDFKDQGKVVVDDGNGDKSGNFTVVDAKNGIFSYTLAPDVYSASGRCWFVLKQGDTVVDTTKTFYFDVLPDALININNNDYISSLSAQLDSFEAATQHAKEEMAQTISQLDSDTANAKSDAEAKIKQAQDTATQTLSAMNDQYSAYAQKYASLESELNAKLTSIQQSADGQLASLKQANDAQIAETIKDVIAKRDAELNQASQDFQNKLSSLQNDYNNWKQTAASDFSSQIQALKSELDNDNSQAQTLKQTLTETQDKVNHLLDKFSDVDFSQFVKNTDFQAFKDTVYDKGTVDRLVAQAGKVKTVEGNGPDGNGNVSLPQISGVKTYDYDNVKPNVKQYNYRDFWYADQSVIQNLLTWLPSKYATNDSVQALNGSLISSVNNLIDPNINNWVFNNEAKQATHSITYSNGVNYFDYAGVSGVEQIYGKINSLPYHTYHVSFDFEPVGSIRLLDSHSNGVQNATTTTTTTTTTSGDYRYTSDHVLKTADISLSGKTHIEYSFESGSNMATYLAFNFGNIYDGNHVNFKISNIMVTPDDAINLTNNTITDAVDLNNFKNPGAWFLTNPNLSNKPDGVGNYLELIVLQSSNASNGIQVVYDTNKNIQYFRVWNANGFNYWKKNSTTDDFANYYNKSEIDRKTTDLGNQVNTLQQKIASITPAVTLTQAQYNALSDDQKNSNTVYLING